MERVVPALWPAIGFVGLYFALALFGLFTIIPWLVHSLLLAAAITATGLALENGFRDFHWPTLAGRRAAAGARQRLGPSPDLRSR